MRRFLLISLFVLLCSSLEAREPWEQHRFKFNVEWGTMCTTYRNHYFYYLPESGGVILDTDDLYPFSFTGQVYIGGEYIFNHWLSSSLLIGYAGVYEDRISYPFLLRANIHPWGFDTDTMYFYADGGFIVGTIQSVMSLNFGAVAHAGAAYRIPISHGISLDMKIAARIIVDHPDIKNPDGPGYLPRERVRNSQVFAGGAELSIGLSF